MFILCLLVFNYLSNQLDQLQIKRNLEESFATKKYKNSQNFFPSLFLQKPNTNKLDLALHKYYSTINSSSICQRIIIWPQAHFPYYRREGCWGYGCTQLFRQYMVIQCCFASLNKNNSMHETLCNKVWENHMQAICFFMYLESCNKPFSLQGIPFLVKNQRILDYWKRRPLVILSKRLKDFWISEKTWNMNTEVEVNSFKDIPLNMWNSLAPKQLSWCAFYYVSKRCKNNEKIRNENRNTDIILSHQPTNNT